LFFWFLKVNYTAIVAHLGWDRGLSYGESIIGFL
jgi:hypothetical protein